MNTVVGKESAKSDRIFYDAQRGINQPDAAGGRSGLNAGLDFNDFDIALRSLQITPLLSKRNHIGKCFIGMRSRIAKSTWLFTTCIEINAQPIHCGFPAFAIDSNRSKQIRLLTKNLAKKW
ncbi:MAG: hypothetical protein KAX57_07160 [Rhodoferax sp.]|nr:hypothetical protein [Rhodoferax sp.]